MQPPNYNPLLLKQLEDSQLNTGEIPEALQDLLTRVSESYDKFREDVKQDDEKVALRTSQLIASTSQAYSFLDSINKGFIMCDTSGEVVLTNNSFQQILKQKTTPENNYETQNNLNVSITTELIDRLFHPELELKALINDCFSTGKAIERDNINFGKSVLHIYLAPLTNEAGTDNGQLLGVVILLEDVTEQKNLDRSKDEFLSIAAHELRTPLTAIRGNASLIKKYYSASITDKNLSEMISDIHESCIRLIGIVNDFLDVAAIEQGKIKMQPENFNLQEIIKEVVRELEQMCSAKGVALVADPTVHDSPPVTADKQRVKQVLINLVGNAMKFTENGSITISTSSDDRQVHIVVADTGRGMSEENQKLLFRKFQQAESSLLTRDTTKGTGLGLYISKLIVELSGGNISLLSSVPGEGSSFTFSLPRSQ